MLTAGIAPILNAGQALAPTFAHLDKLGRDPARSGQVRHRLLATPGVGTAWRRVTWPPSTIRPASPDRKLSVRLAA